MGGNGWRMVRNGGEWVRKGGNGGEWWVMMGNEPQNVLTSFILGGLSINIPLGFL